MTVKIISLSPFFGGGESFINNLVLLIQKHCDVEVYCRNETLHEILLKYDSIIVHRINGNSNLRALQEAFKILIKNYHEGDIIILNGQLESNLCSLFAVYGFKCIIIRHSLLSMTSFSKRVLFYFSCLFSKKVVCVSESLQREFPLLLNSKTTVIHNWSNMESMSGNLKYNYISRMLSSNDNSLMIYYIGRVAQGKNVEDLILACKDIQGVKLNIVGDGDELAYLKSKYAKKVKFHGFLPQDDLLYHFSQADLCVSCSSYETFGLTLLEASYYGIPLLVTNIPAHYELTQNGKNAILFKVHNIKDLKKQIIYLMNNRQALVKLSIKSNLVYQSFSPQKAKENYLNLLEQVSMQ